MSSLRRNTTQLLECWPPDGATSAARDKQHPPSRSIGPTDSGASDDSVAAAAPIASDEGFVMSFKSNQVAPPGGLSWSKRNKLPSTTISSVLRLEEKEKEIYHQRGESRRMRTESDSLNDLELGIGSSSTGNTKQAAIESGRLVDETERRSRRRRKSQQRLQHPSQLKQVNSGEQSSSKPLVSQRQYQTQPRAAADDVISPSTSVLGLNQEVALASLSSSSSVLSSERVVVLNSPTEVERPPKCNQEVLVASSSSILEANCETTITRKTRRPTASSSSASSTASTTTTTSQSSKKQQQLVVVVVGAREKELVRSRHADDDDEIVGAVCVDQEENDELDQRVSLLKEEREREFQLRRNRLNSKIKNKNRKSDQGENLSGSSSRTKRQRERSSSITSDYFSSSAHNSPAIQLQLATTKTNTNLSQSSFQSKQQLGGSNLKLWQHNHSNKQKPENSSSSSKEEEEGESELKKKKESQATIYENPLFVVADQLVADEKNELELEEKAEARKVGIIGSSRRISSMRAATKTSERLPRSDQRTNTNTNISKQQEEEERVTVGLSWLHRRRFENQENQKQKKQEETAEVEVEEELEELELANCTSKRETKSGPKTISNNNNNTSSSSSTQSSRSSKCLVNSLYLDADTRGGGSTIIQRETNEKQEAEYLREEELEFGQRPRRQPAAAKAERIHEKEEEEEEPAQREEAAAATELRRSNLSSSRQTSQRMMMMMNHQDQNHQQNHENEEQNYEYEHEERINNHTQQEPMAATKNSNTNGSAANYYHYYYSTPAQAAAGIQLSSLTSSSQMTTINDETQCDESSPQSGSSSGSANQTTDCQPSNCTESLLLQRHHFNQSHYQNPNQHHNNNNNNQLEQQPASQASLLNNLYAQPDSFGSSSNELISSNSHFYQQPTSPTCRQTVQRIVSNLFSQQQQQQHKQQSQATNNNQATLASAALANRDLIAAQNYYRNSLNCEPLIRSSSWQNKTLIDLRQQKHNNNNNNNQQQQYNQNPSPLVGLHYLESSLMQQQQQTQKTPSFAQSNGTAATLAGGANSRYSRFPPPNSQFNATRAAQDSSNSGLFVETTNSPSLEHLYYGITQPVSGQFHSQTHQPANHPNPNNYAHHRHAPFPLTTMQHPQQHQLDYIQPESKKQLKKKKKQQQLNYKTTTGTLLDQKHNYLVDESFQQQQSAAHHAFGEKMNNHLSDDAAAGGGHFYRHLSPHTTTGPMPVLAGGFQFPFYSAAAGAAAAASNGCSSSSNNSSTLVSGANFKRKSKPKRLRPENTNLCARLLHPLWFLFSLANNKRFLVLLLSAILACAALLALIITSSQQQQQQQANHHHQIAQHDKAAAGVGVGDELAAKSKLLLMGSTMGTRSQDPAAAVVVEQQPVAIFPFQFKPATGTQGSGGSNSFDSSSNGNSNALGNFFHFFSQAQTPTTTTTRAPSIVGVRLPPTTHTNEAGGGELLISPTGKFAPTLASKQVPAAPEPPTKLSSTQIYWRTLGATAANNNNKTLEHCLSGQGAGMVCSGRGECHQNRCFCFASFSGPYCEIGNCANECSQRGQCKLKADSSINNLGAFKQVTAATQAGELVANSELEEAQLNSIAFQSLSSSRWRNSICPTKLESELTPVVSSIWQDQQQMMSNSWALRLSGNKHEPIHTYDNRLEWSCQCDIGYTGDDCSQRQELECDNEKDDDLDGFIDCEDDDCCSGICRENVMCLKAPEPRRFLQQQESKSKSENANGKWWQPTSEATKNQSGMTSNNNNNKRRERENMEHHFFAQVKFLIANETLQQYANSSAFDSSRAAVIRGQVTTNRAGGGGGGRRGIGFRSTGIGGVRVGVLESARFGFTLTRADGYFDMLVNGDEWITLQFHRNAYSPIKRKVFVRSNTINVLEEEVEMLLAAATTTTTSASQQEARSRISSLINKGDSSVGSSQQQQQLNSAANQFGLQFLLELHKLTTNAMTILTAATARGQQQQQQQRDDEQQKRQISSRGHELFDCLLSHYHELMKMRLDSVNSVKQLEPKLVVIDSADNQEKLTTFILVSSNAQQTQLELTSSSSNGSKLSSLAFVYNSAFFEPANSISKPVISIELLPPESNSSQQHSMMIPKTLVAIHVRLDIEGQSKRESLEPTDSLHYHFAWNRRNVYGQKVYGFSELNVRVGYELQLPSHDTNNNNNNTMSPSSLTNKLLFDCWRGSSKTQRSQQKLEPLVSGGGEHFSFDSSSSETSDDDDDQFPSSSSSSIEQQQQRALKLTGLSEFIQQHQQASQIIWFERKIYMEANQLNEFADVGKWSLNSLNRLDLERELIYFGSGWNLPYSLVYPPVVSAPIELEPSAITAPKLTGSGATAIGGSRQEEPTLIYQQQQQEEQQHHQYKSSSEGEGGSMTRGPNSSLFILLAPSMATSANTHQATVKRNNDNQGRLIQWDPISKRRLLDVPLAPLMSKLRPDSGFNSAQHPNQPTTTTTTTMKEQEEQEKDLQLLYNNYLSSLYLSSRVSGKIIQVSYSSLLALNKSSFAQPSATFSSPSYSTTASQSSAAAAALVDGDQFLIEPLCGFGQHFLTRTDSSHSSSTTAEALKSARATRLLGPHSMTLDERNQILYFVDGRTNLVALELSSHFVFLLQAFAPPTAAAAIAQGQQKEPDGATLRAVKPEGERRKKKKKVCSAEREAKMAPTLAEYKADKIHSLAWSRTESSLYFVDQNVVFALRQDFTLEPIAWGKLESRSEFLVEFLAQSKCMSMEYEHKDNGDDNQTQATSELGLVKSLAVDETNQHLLIVHQWFSSSLVEQQQQPPSTTTTNKVSGLFYLAKVPLGFKNKPNEHGAFSLSGGKVIDLHSASSAWDPQIMSLVPAMASSNLYNQGNNNQASQGATKINWNELARPLAGAGAKTASATATTIPFIHLSGGFKRVDSIEISSKDGSIFVLHSSSALSRSHSITLIETYSSKLLRQFNQLERNDVNINRLLMVNSSRGNSNMEEEMANQSGSYSRFLTASSGNRDINQNFNKQEENENEVESSQLNVLLVQNPISTELMEFHSTSGLQLSLTSSFPLSSSSSSHSLLNGRGPLKTIEFYYKVLSSSNNLLELDEDDKYDFQVHKLIRQHLSATSRTELNFNSTASNSVLRLEKVLDLSTGTQLELVRSSPSSSRFVLQTILENRQPICELVTDRSGLLTSYQQLSKDFWIELIYDSSTHLLRDMLVKEEPSTAFSGQFTSNSNKDWRQRKRIVYDRIFNHYCDLFIVNA